MQKQKTVSLIAELANVLDKFDAHILVNDIIDDMPEVYLITDSWEPIEIDYAWKTGIINAEMIRSIKLK